MSGALPPTSVLISLCLQTNQQLYARCFLGGSRCSALLLGLFGLLLGLQHILSYPTDQDSPHQSRSKN